MKGLGVSLLISFFFFAFELISNFFLHDIKDTNGHLLKQLKAQE